MTAKGDDGSNVVTRTIDKHTLLVGYIAAIVTLLLVLQVVEVLR